MPIQVDADVGVLSEELFKEIAYAVTGVAFSLHNEYGKFFAEKLYKHEIAAECRKQGLQRIEIEVPIRVTHGDFVKDYFADRRVGMEYQLAPFERMDLPGWRKRLRERIRSYAAANNVKVDRLVEDRGED